ncbi:hypothetical protein BD309DRAFT_945513 [Dichomitus squalens]|uniref:Putative gamma-glutamylcyclotransferase n=1 Tax=Dichomitus squalens TaxID=114155 RepID=A0A4V2K647_9APHY|nr:uncharacterized protein DICSQDRAFT_52231 [Dichomitus squalens LYAD-421 SS1]EJF64746.1 hypothetical protein DICSQDRAFT_52231 [Dichomitus squalens LYAD-421 SS1]TBU50413.1 hypothetical protein BD309DRAFT_945513 [Dichomitus squalens]TBU62949.1 hypothetical protein BD310DRAFT_917486 [Dichomitus squalens]
MSHTAFFYGTLLHPSILRRVIGHEGSRLQICPALLLEHTRHKIRHADYPAVLPFEKSRELFLTSGHTEPPANELNVRGSLVTGLNDNDIALLDLFEGDEYTRENVLVHPLGPLTSLSHTPPPRTAIPNIGSSPSNAATDAYIVPLRAPELPPLDALPPPLPAQTYIYAGPLRDLSPELWSYEDFVRENAWKWVGTGARDNEYYVEVDRRRDMDGKTLKTEIVDTGSVPGSDEVGEAVAVEIQGP